MRTRLGAFCDHLIEASWLLALMGVPLFFNIFTNRVFEPDKLTLLRTITSLAAVFWLVSQMEHYQRARQREQITLRAFVSRPLVLPVLLVVVAYLVSTAASIIPSVSLWGSYVRLQGLYTNFSYLVLFGLLVQRLRDGAQLRRLLNVVILTSLPIAMYGLVQRHGLDPLPWGGDVTRRVTSTMGNAIFVAAYLIMVMPITAMRWIELQRRALEGLSPRSKRLFDCSIWILLFAQCVAWFALSFGQGVLVTLCVFALLFVLARHLRVPAHRLALLGVYSLTLSAQLASTVYTQSRGPLLGLGAGMAIAGLSFLAVTRRRKSVFASLGAVLVILVALLLMNIPGSPLNAVREIPYAGRMARLLETEQGSGRVRLLIWEGSVDLVKADPVRALIGYGPEAMYVAYNPFYPPELAHFEARNASPDRAHNETFDALITMGFLGLATYVILFSSLFYLGLARIGLVQSPGEKGAFFAVLGLGGLIGVVLPWAIQKSPALSGLGLAYGMIVGLMAYVMVQVALRAWRHALGGLAEPSWHTLIVIGLLGGIVGHFVEINVGISIAATKTYLWAFAALLILLGQRRAELEMETTDLPLGSASVTRSGRDTRKRSRQQRRAAPSRELRERFVDRHGHAIIAGLLLAYMFVTLFWDYIANTRSLSNPIDIIIRSLVATGVQPGGGAMALMMLIAFAAVTLALVAEYVEGTCQRRSVTWWLTACGLAASIGGGIALIYALVHATKLTPGKSTLGLISEYYALMALIGLALAVQLLAYERKAPVVVRSWWALAYLAPLVAALLFVGQVNLTSVKADILYKQGLKFDGASNWDQAIVFYSQAGQMVPQEDYYQLFLGRAMLEKAKRMAESPDREGRFEQAIEVLERAYELNHFNTDHTANLARAYRSWAEATTDPTLRQQRFARALDYYDQATQLSPNNAELYNEWGLIYAMMGDEERALATYEVSLGLDDQFVQTHLLIGDIYFARQDWRRVVDIYQRALSDQQGAGAYAWSRLAYAYSQLGETDHAIEANLQVLGLAPNDYVTLRNLAFLYDESGHPAEALSYAAKAVSAAPEQDKSSLESFRQYLAQKVSAGGKP